MEYETSDQNASTQQCKMSTGTVFSLIGGAGLGALLMYLFDPEEGKQRREYFGELASNAAESAGSALQSSWETLRDKGSEYGRASYDALTNMGSNLSDHASNLSDYATDLADRARSSRMGKRISKQAGYLSDESSDRLRYLLHGRENHGLESGTSQILAAVGCVALGFGAMYLLDPADGARRRGVLRDKLFSTFRRLGRSVSGMSKDLGNRATGMAHQARSRLSREQVADHVLEDRIRSTIGRSTPIHNVMVECDNGTVTLSGSIPESQVDGLLRAVWKVRGVNELVNRLNLGQFSGGSIDSMNALSANTTSSGQRIPETYDKSMSGNPDYTNDSSCEPNCPTPVRQGETSGSPMGTCPPSPTQL